MSNEKAKAIRRVLGLANLGFSLALGGNKKSE